MATKVFISWSGERSRIVAEAAKENALSRIYVGFHFRHATDVGLAQGRQIGNYVVRNALIPLAK